MPTVAVVDLLPLTLNSYFSYIYRSVFDKWPPREYFFINIEGVHGTAILLRQYIDLTLIVRLQQIFKLQGRRRQYKLLFGTFLK